MTNWCDTSVTLYSFIRMQSSEFDHVNYAWEQHKWHISDSRLIGKFNEIHRFSIFAFFLWAAFAVFTSLLVLEYLLVECIFAFILKQTSKLAKLWFFRLRQLDNNSNMTEILILSMASSWGFTLIFVVCEPGEYVTKEFDAFGKELGQCDWHSLPNKLRRLYLIFLLDTQQSINIECYGRILCIRDTFKKVV